MMEELKNKLILKKSIIEKNGNLVRMVTPIIENGEERKVFVEVEKKWAKYLTTERADSVLFLVLPVALREGYDIYCESPVTEMFLHNINEILIPHLALGDKRIKKIKVYATTESSKIGGKGVGTGISCGVDSLHTVQEYTRGLYPDMELSHLVIASANAELWNTVNSDMYHWESEHKTQFERYNEVCDYTGLPLVKIYSNYFHYVCSKVYKRDWAIYHHLYVHTYITMATVLSLKKLWKTYYFSSAYDFTYFNLNGNMTEDAAYCELLLMETLTVPDFFCFSGGAQYDRADKMRMLMDYPLAQKTLHPCHSDGKMNCTKPWCGKCLRSLIVLDYYDKLDCFKDVFDIEAYRKNHFQYIYWTVHRFHEPHGEAFFKPLYQMILEKYPNDVERAEKNYAWNISTTVSKEQYNAVNRCYEICLKLLQTDNPSQVLTSFFSAKGVEKLYISGQSNFGSTLKQLLSNSIKLYDYKTANATDCDAVLIIDTADSVIEGRKKTIRQRGVNASAIYTIADLQGIFK